jgi:hypothetical protein
MSQYIWRRIILLGIVNSRPWAGWCSGNALDLYSGSIRFESLPGYWIYSLRCFMIYAHPFSKCRVSMSTLITPRPLPSTSFPIHYWSVIFPFDDIYCEIQIVLWNIPQKKVNSELSAVWPSVGIQSRGPGFKSRAGIYYLDRFTLVAPGRCRDNTVEPHYNGPYYNGQSSEIPRIAARARCQHLQPVVFCSVFVSYCSHARTYQFLLTNLWILSLSKPSVGQKRKRKTLSLHDKLSLIQKLEKGVSVSSICAEYGIINTFYR